MRHNKKGRKLGTSSGHTKAMRKSLVGALFTNDRIKTVEARAKEIRPDVDKIITWAKKGANRFPVHQGGSGTFPDFPQHIRNRSPESGTEQV